MENILKMGKKFSKNGKKFGKNIQNFNTNCNKRENREKYSTLVKNV